MLVETTKMEQRYEAVLAVIRDGFSVREVADKFGVSRQSVHTWLVRYEQGGLSAQPFPLVVVIDAHPQAKVGAAAVLREHG